MTPFTPSRSASGFGTCASTVDFPSASLRGPGVSYAYISRIEAGARRPSVKALRTLAPKLDVTVEYLETGSDLREVEERELRLAEAELELRLGENPSEGEHELTTLFSEARAAGDLLATTRAEIALGFAASRRGDAREAVKRLEEAIELGSLTSSARPDVYTALGRAYSASGVPELAVELFERSLAEIVERAPDGSAAQDRFSVYLSHTLGELGQFERAKRYSQRSRTLPSRSSESASTARSDGWRRSKATPPPRSTTSGARSPCWRSPRTLPARSRPPRLCVDADLFRPRPGSWNLPRDRRAAVRPGAAGNRSRVSPHRAGQTGRTARRRPRGCQASPRRARNLGDGDPTERGSALAALAEGLVLAGEVAEAEKSFHQASDLLDAHGQRREFAEVLRRWARLLRNENCQAEALEVLERAVQVSICSERGEAPTLS